MVVYDSTGSKVVTVLDTKWKNRIPGIPDDADLKQMMAYNYYFGSRQSALIYPASDTTATRNGT